MIDFHKTAQELIEQLPKYAECGQATLIAQALSEFFNAGKQEERWQPIHTAPKDGTHILILVVHANAKFSRNPIEEGWIAVHTAHWTDFNNGGWVWNGLCGIPAYWQPFLQAWQIIRKVDWP